MLFGLIARILKIPYANRFADSEPFARRLAVEPLEDRRLLSVTSPQIEFFNTSPALFVANQGQWADTSVRFVHQGDGANVEMTDKGPVFQVFRTPSAGGLLTADPISPLPGGLQDPHAPANAPTEMLQFSASFVGANTLMPTGLDASQTQFNYFVSNPSNWHANVPSYQSVAYENLYAGIDLQTWGQRSHLKYEFHVAPGADYQQIQVHYAGIEGLSINADGSLQVNLDKGWGELSDDAPYIYQNIGGKQVAVASQYHLIDSQTYSFTITGKFDATQELVIDPDLAWATYLGGSGTDTGLGIAVDASGNAFVTGYTDSTNFTGANNTLHGSGDAYVAKISTGGALAWVTYLGGSGGEQSIGITLDASGNAFVTGYTTSTDFAGTTNSKDSLTDGFVAKVSTAGVLAWATYLGGRGNDYGQGISVDASGNAFVTGYTDSTNFTGANNSYLGGTDAFVAKVSTGGALAWATYLGGAGTDTGFGISVDASGNAFVTGYTGSTNFAGANNSYHSGGDAFVAKVSTGGALAWATYLGGSGIDGSVGISVNAAGNAFLTGQTSSMDFAGANNSFHGGGSDSFVAKISPAGVLARATYVGGSGNDFGQGISVDASSNAFVTGYTDSTNFAGATNSNHGGRDAYVAKVSTGGALAWVTYLGGSGGDEGYGISVDVAGDVFMAGFTKSIDFAGATNSNHGGYDAFLAKVTALFFTDFTATASDWTDAGLTLTLTGDGLLHLYRTGTTTDAIPPQPVAYVTGVDITGRILFDVLTVESMGTGVPSLSIHNATLIVSKDDAISAGTNVTVDGGALDFQGHSDPIGNLIVKNYSHAMVTAINNTKTTVETGKLTATSIVSDTLTIGKPVLVVFTARASDWTDTGLTLKLTGDGMLHLSRTGTTTDAIPPQPVAYVTGVDITARILFDVLTVESMGTGLPSLSIHRATLTISKDDAISAGTNVTVDGGALDFNGHFTSTGNLTVENYSHVTVTALKNRKTTVETGRLSASSIVCDTLSIGSGPGTASGSVQTDVKGTALTKNAAKRLPASESAPATSESETKSTIASTLSPYLIETPAIHEQPLARQASSAKSLPITNIPAVDATVDSQLEPNTAVVSSYSATISPVVNPAITPTAIASANQLLKKPDWQQWAFNADAFMATKIDNQYGNSFANPSFITEQLNGSAYNKLADSPATAKKPSSPSMTGVQNAHDLALQSIVKEFQQGFATEQVDSELLVDKHLHKQDKLAQNAVDDFHLQLIASD